MLIRGSVPGSEGGWVLIKDAAKRKAPGDLPFPAALRAAEAPAAEGEELAPAAIEDTAPEASEGPTP